ncbi:hypothetical protein EDC02_5015 [Micromonospora sp. Llam0]|uniref:hypothetical protein n=1 Tax=Micromonospora sp. Llam0 TaxID=2485143 RepID=UPI000F4AD896|nr:hypothetical protein [Micromonospora sp. Llam0]ROO63006.1 hypothetical protein EDC02_5015 [Micromonospora sp. Llam0]
MLSFRTTHAITGELIAATHSAHWRGHPLLLLIQDRPAAQPTVPDARHLRVTPIDLPERLWTERPGGVAAVLHILAAGAVHPTRHDDDSFGPDARTLAVAVCYDDIVTAPALVAAIRRVEAVDTDGRVYQLSQLPDEDNAVVIVNERPDPRDTPATYPGLRGLLHALRRQPTS